jgi:hypothetical protein
VLLAAQSGQQRVLHAPFDEHDLVGNHVRSEQRPRLPAPTLEIILNADFVHAS